MAGYDRASYISGTTGLVRLICSNFLLGVYVYKAELILAEYKLRENVSHKLMARGWGCNLVDSG